jgi:hypothetical protein
MRRLASQPTTAPMIRVTITLIVPPPPEARGVYQGERDSLVTNLVEARLLCITTKTFMAT